ncbi:hypothetical protein A3Q29_16565 [Providencia stuartii]|uniref:Bacteriophage protein n=1 Tax=Providencia stuartii TaxID=588 RepID=A0A1S1HSE7_PROST|nr:hypothetical protein A3Q29_16565 [Providencia stuartii]
MRDYLKLITSRHQSAPKFKQHIDLITRSLSDISVSANTLNPHFSLDEAIGVQLDAVGEWVGIRRHVETPIIDTYFSLDTDATGFDSGMWKRPLDPSTGFTALDDDTYRSIIKIKVQANNWDGTSESLTEIYNELVIDEDSKIFFVDNLDMSIDVYITGSVISAVTKAIIRQGYLRVKPQGVNVNNYYYNANPKSPVFGFDIENEYIAGFDQSGFSIKL